MVFIKGHSGYWLGKKRSQKTKDKISKSSTGKPAWNKGIKGTHFSPNTEFKKGQTVGEKNGHWKGDNAGKPAMHLWVIGKLGKPKRCEFCGTTTAIKFDWANKTGLYKRNLVDWIRLCRSCHIRYDKPFKNRNRNNLGQFN